MEKLLSTSHKPREAYSRYDFLRQLSQDKRANRDREVMMSKIQDLAIKEASNLDEDLVLKTNINSFKNNKSSYAHLHRNARKFIQCMKDKKMKEAADAYFQIKTSYHNSYPDEVKDYCKQIGLTSLES